MLTRWWERPGRPGAFKSWAMRVLMPSSVILPMRCRPDARPPKERSLWSWPRSGCVSGSCRCRLFFSNVARMRTLAKIGADRAVLGRTRPLCIGHGALRTAGGVIAARVSAYPRGASGVSAAFRGAGRGNGSQGEWVRAAQVDDQTHPDLSLDAGDTVILCRKPFPVTRPP